MQVQHGCEVKVRVRRNISEGKLNAERHVIQPDFKSKVALSARIVQY